MSTTDQISTQLPAGTWTVDPVHTTIGFVARHMMVSKVRGTFGEFSADVTIGDDPLQSTVSAEVQMASIDTGNADRDGHLRTNDFFDIENHPTMTLRSTGIEAKGDGDVMHADLTVRGVTRSVDVDLEFNGTAQDPWGGTRAGITATTTINRKDFGIEWNTALETGGVLVGDKVDLELDVQLVKA
ncbi:MAG: YceI family protein [Ilumatobacteraceae bacterium]